MRVAGTDASDAVAPRVQAGANPQHLLATVLGEYLDSSDALLPAAAVCALLAEFGISPASARATPARLARRGLLAARGRGRATTYHLTPQTLARHRSTMHRYLSFGASTRESTGRWLAVSYSLPEAEAALRHAVRRELGALGFVRLYDSVWIAPDAQPGPVRVALEQLVEPVEGARWSVMHVRFDDETGRHGPAAAYGLDGLAAAYRAFVEEHADLHARVRAGQVGPAQALVARTTLMDAWRRFADTDPDLPAHLLPDPWPRARARELFLDVHTALGPPAARRLVEVMSPTWPDADRWVTYFVAGDGPQDAPRRGAR